MDDEEKRRKWREKKQRQRAAAPKPERKPKEKTEGEKKSRPTRYFTVRPLDESKWALVAANNPWLVYKSRKEPVQGWVGARVIATSKVPDKASYWLGWNGDRLARQKDSNTMESHRPELYAWVVSVLKGNS